MFGEPKMNEGSRRELHNNVHELGHFRLIVGKLVSFGLEVVATLKEPIFFPTVGVAMASTVKNA